MFIYIIASPRTYIGSDGCEDKSMFFSPQNTLFNDVFAGNKHGVNNQLRSPWTTGNVYNKRCFFFEAPNSSDDASGKVALPRCGKFDVMRDALMYIYIYIFTIISHLDSVDVLVCVLVYIYRLTFGWVFDINYLQCKYLYLRTNDITFKDLYTLLTRRLSQYRTFR